MERANRDRWYIRYGDQGDVVLSSRIRLARNLKEYPFPGRLSEEGAKEVCARVTDVLSRYDGAHLTSVNMSDLSPELAVSLAERHMISPEFTDIVPGRALAVSDDESISIMICENDHIRIQTMCAGFSLDEAYRAASAVDDYLDSQLTYAFDERLGYLTRFPTEVGTAMRASVLLHLPALARNWEIARLSSTVEKLGLSLRGPYGEVDAANGDIYRLSNRLTMGLSEKTALENLRSVTLQIATRERAAREVLEKDVAYMDKIYRAYGVLSTARVLTSAEMAELLSAVRLGAVGGYIPVKPETVNELSVLLQPATLNVELGGGSNSAIRDAKRAEHIRAVLAEDAGK